jgi:hypothetical protein
MIVNRPMNPMFDLATEVEIFNLSGVGSRDSFRRVLCV